MTEVQARAVESLREVERSCEEKVAAARDAARMTAHNVTQSAEGNLAAFNAKLAEDVEIMEAMNSEVIKKNITINELENILADMQAQERHSFEVIAQQESLVIEY